MRGSVDYFHANDSEKMPQLQQNGRGKKGLNAFTSIGLFQPEPVLPACQCDDVAGRVVIVGGLPRGVSLVIERSRGATDHFIERVFLCKRKGVPSRTDMDPQQVGQAGQTACAVDTLSGIRG